MCVYIKSPGWFNTNKLDKNISGFIHSMTHLYNNNINNTGSSLNHATMFSFCKKQYLFYASGSSPLKLREVKREIDTLA